MVDTHKTYDVFVSHAANATKLAKELAASCRASGLEAITSAELLEDKNASEALWEALAESRAMLAVLSSPALTPQMGIEVGAGRAWLMPIFGILTDLSMTQPPSGLAGIRLYPSGRIEDVIRAIKSSAQDLSKEDHTLLAKLYTEVGVSVDQLALEPDALDELGERFHTDTGKSVAGERLLSELLRMRKQGRLTKSGSAGRAKPRKGTA